MATTSSETWPELWWDLPLAVMDVETTGFDPEVDRIIEIGIVHMVRGEVTDSWGRLVNPGREIPQEVVELTGIQQADVDDEPPFAAIAAEVAQRLSGRGIVAYNLPFDRKFVAAELARAGQAWPDENPTSDPLIFARQFHGGDNVSKKLGAVAARLGIDLVEAHRAVDDATTAGYVLYAFRDQLPERLADLLVLQAQWERRQEAEAARRFRRVSNQEASSFLADDLGTIGLGPGYIYGGEPDPLRALYSSVPEARREPPPSDA